MTAFRPPAYWRQNKNWPNLLGKTGTVILAAADFVLVDIGGQRYELMAVAGNQLKPRDKVICVFRRLSLPVPSGLIEYGIKVRLLKS